MNMRIVYMGTPDFAVPPLRAMAQAGYEIAAVVTQPDKPRGRGKSLQPTPVKEEALRLGIAVWALEKIEQLSLSESDKYSVSLYKAIENSAKASAGGNDDD